jgi:hypothetical protein
VRRAGGDDACGAAFTDDAARGLDAIEPFGGGAVFAATSVATPAGTPGSRTLLSASATVVGGGAVSVLATTVLGAAVSAFGGDEADCADGFDRMWPVSDGASLRRTHMVPTITTSTAAPTPLHTCGAIGGRSGFVPHHRHSPDASG